MASRYRILGNAFREICKGIERANSAKPGSMREPALSVRAYAL
jgi:hypothetical protein